jgi:hypothetical protein
VIGLVRLGEEGEALRMLLPGEITPPA